MMTTETSHLLGDSFARLAGSLHLFSFFVVWQKSAGHKHGSCSRRVSARCIRDVSWNLSRHFVRAGDAPIAEAPYFIRPRKKIHPAPLQVFFYWPFALFASPACDFVYGAKTNNKQHKREIWYSVNNTGRREQARECSRRLHRQFIRRFIALRKRKFASQPSHAAENALDWGGVRSKEKLFVFVCLFLSQTKCKLKHNMKLALANLQPTETKV